MNNKLIAASVLAALMLSGCSIFAPYDSEFQCNRNRDFGKCTDVQGAYSDALGGEMDEDHPITDPKDKDGKKAAKARKAAKAKGGDEAVVESRSSRTREDDKVARESFNRFKAAEYNEMAELIERPVTPIVAPPKTLRTLVVAYKNTPGQTLYLPRFIYFFASDGAFVLGDYLNSDSSRGGSGGTTMYPNGSIEGLR